MAFDRSAARIVAITGGDPTANQTWTFDVCTNTWTQMHPEREPGGWDSLVYDVDSDLTVEVDSMTRRVWAYDLEADIWTLKGPLPRTWQGRPRVIYDPVSGLIVALGSSELWTYEVETDTWAPVRVVNPFPGGSFSDRRVLAYDASVDRFVAIADDPGETRLFDRYTGRWARSATAMPGIGFGYGPTGGDIAYDEGGERTVVFDGGWMVAYRAATDSWETLVSRDDSELTLSTSRWYHTMVYDPVNQRLVVYGGEHPTSDPTVWVGSDDVLAFDPATREWSLLLKAATVQRVQ
ncbi:MAG TPA: kelch repeat-containing protein [Candidatus Limnocylindrales bacterium]